MRNLHRNMSFEYSDRTGYSPVTTVWSETTSRVQVPSASWPEPRVIGLP